MAGEVFVARQDTLESVKGTVEDIDTNLGTPDYAGGGTDVVAMIGALASAVTTLQSDIDSVKTAIAGMGGSGVSIKEYKRSGSTGTSTYTISKPAIVIFYKDGSDDSVLINGNVPYLINSYEVNNDTTSVYIAFAPANSTIKLTVSSRYDTVSAQVLEIG